MPVCDHSYHIISAGLCLVKRKSVIVIPTLLVLSLLLNLAAWLIPGFSDWYTEELFPLVTVPLARMTGLLSFSLGEWMLLAAMLWIVILAGVVIVLAFHFVQARRDAASGDGGCGDSAADTDPSGGTADPKLSDGILRSGRVMSRIGQFPRRYIQATGWLIAIIAPIMTLNCFILYHTTPLEESLSGYGQEYTIEELGELRDYIVERCNTLSEEMPRDENGEVIYEGGEDAMAETAREAVSLLGEREDLPAALSRLRGWQTTPKALFFSGFVSQQYIQGYYFPFSMEANYNSIMKIMNKPSTMCHELAHTHGFIYEDEANLIGFLACVGSEDVIFQYSGWLSVLYYVNNSYYANVDEATYKSHPSISERVRFDNEFLSDEAWEEVEEDALLDTGTVKAATDTYLDTTLKANGVESGKASYSHVVELLLMYYDGTYD